MNTISITSIKRVFIGVITVLALLAGSTQTLMAAKGGGGGPEGQQGSFPLGGPTDLERECTAIDPVTDIAVAEIEFGPAITGVNGDGFPTGYGTGLNLDEYPRLFPCPGEPGLTCLFHEVRVTLLDPDAVLSKFFVTMDDDSTFKGRSLNCVVQCRPGEEKPGEEACKPIKDIDNSFQQFRVGKCTDTEPVSGLRNVGTFVTLATLSSFPTRQSAIVHLGSGKDIIKVSCSGAYVGNISVFRTANQPACVNLSLDPDPSSVCIERDSSGDPSNISWLRDIGCPNSACSNGTATVSGLASLANTILAALPVGDELPDFSGANPDEICLSDDGSNECMEKVEINPTWYIFQFGDKIQCKCYDFDNTTEGFVCNPDQLLLPPDKCK